MPRKYTKKKASKKKVKKEPKKKREGPKAKDVAKRKEMVERLLVHMAKKDKKGQPKKMRRCCFGC